MRLIALSLTVLLALASLGCATAASKTFREPPPIPAHQVTTPGLLLFLAEQAADYRFARSDLVGRLRELDRTWRALLEDMLGNAPTADDFNARANVLGLTADERRLYEQLFLARDR